jgi:glycosyltransferase involved in cell wall biosynthesis
LLSSIPSEVPVHRAEGNVPAGSSGIKRRLEGWLKLQTPFSRWWIDSATKAGVKAIDGCELIFATMSPFEGGEVAQSLSRRFGIPWVADLRDPWALDEMQVYPSFLHRRLERARMGKLLKTATAIIMNTPEAVTALLHAFPDFKNKLVVSITNGFDQSDFAAPLPARSDKKFRIVHSGYLHTDSGLQLRNKHLQRLLRGAELGVDILTRSHAILLEAIERWCSERPPVRQDLELLLAGKASKEDEAVAANSAVARLVRFTGYLSHPESLELVRTADLLFLPMHNLAPGRRSRIVPGKTYEYMASGRPILAAVPTGDARDYLDRAGTAFLCPPDDVSGMIAILDRVYLAWQQGESLVQRDDDFIRRFERRHLTHMLAHTFSNILTDTSHSTKHPIKHTSAAACV